MRGQRFFWGMLGRGDGGLRGIGVSGSGYNIVLALEVLNVVDCVKQKRLAELLASGSAPRAVAAVLSFQACLCACICTFCMCVCIYVYVCMCVDIYICMSLYMHMCVYMYMYAFIHILYMYVYVYLHRLWVSVSALQRVDDVMHVHVYSCAYVCACTLEQVFWALVHGQVCTLHRCFLNTNVHICEHTRCRLCTYVHKHIYAYMHAYVYGCVCASIILLDTLRRR